MNIFKFFIPLLLASIVSTTLLAEEKTQSQREEIAAKLIPILMLLLNDTGNTNDTPIPQDTFDHLNLAYQFGKARQGNTNIYNPASHSIDGKEATYSRTECNNQDNWIEIQLPTSTKIKKIIIHNTPMQQDRLKNAEMYISSQPYDGELADDEWINFLTEDEKQIFNLNPIEEGQYLFIKAENDNCLHLSEIEIYGTPLQPILQATKPIVIKHLPPESFSEDNQTFTLTYDKNGTIESTCGEVLPSQIKANISTDFKFVDIDVGKYTGCKITVKLDDDALSQSITLDDFRFHKILKSQKLRGRSDGKGLDYVILADGFKESEMALFRTKALAFSNAMLNYDSNLSLEHNAWNIFIIEAVSKESGADNKDGDNGTKVDTAIDSYFWCRGIERLICTNTSLATQITSRYVPQFDKILVLVNSDKYGGSGGNIATVSLKGGSNVVTHELGHSLAGLADEYAYGGYFAPSIEPKNVNVTINNDLETVKWKHWVGEPTIDDNKPVGLYEGGKYVKTGVWRPTSHSIMRENGKPFYYVNAEQWALSVYKIAGVIYSKNPKNNQITQTMGSDSIFTVEPSMGASAQQIVWQVDDVNQSIANDQFTFTYGKDKINDYTVKAIINDKTGVIRKDTHGYSTQTIVWNITVN